MKAAELRDMPSEDIIVKMNETRRELFNLRFQKETEQMEKPAELRHAKHLIARCQTILREREIETANATV